MYTTIQRRVAWIYARVSWSSGERGETEVAEQQMEEKRYKVAILRTECKQITKC